MIWIHNHPYKASHVGWYPIFGHTPYSSRCTKCCKIRPSSSSSTGFIHQLWTSRGLEGHRSASGATEKRWSSRLGGRFTAAWQSVQHGPMSHLDPKPDTSWFGSWTIGYPLVTWHDYRTWPIEIVDFPIQDGNLRWPVKLAHRNSWSHDFPIEDGDLSLAILVSQRLPSSNLTVCYWTWPLK